VIKRSITLAGSKTFVSLEDAFWDGMYEIAASEKMTTSALIEKIDSSRSNHNVSSAWFRESDLGFSQDEGYYTRESGLMRSTLKKRGSGLNFWLVSRFSRTWALRPLLQRI
jgi:Ribbon-helix-helix domain